MHNMFCLCPASIAWIRKHLMKSARHTFTNMIRTGSITKIARKVRHHKRRFSAEQLAAQRLFAKRAKAGTLRHGTRRRRRRRR